MKRPVGVAQLALLAVHLVGEVGSRRIVRSFSDVVGVHDAVRPPSRRSQRAPVGRPVVDAAGIGDLDVVARRGQLGLVEVAER